MSEITKTVKLYLTCEQYDKDGNPVDYKEIFKILFHLQDQTREIKNKTIQYCWEYNNFSSDYYKQNHEYPKEIDILSYKTLGGYVNDKFKTGNDLYSGNCSTTVRNTCKEFNNSKKALKKGEKSIISYKSNQPLDLHNKTIRFEYINHEFYVYLKLLNRNSSKQYNFSSTEIRFKNHKYDNSSKTIMERCIDKIYKISASKLLYDTKKKMWALNLAYSFTPQKAPNLDKDKVLGVDLGIVYPICASVYGDFHYFKIDGGEIENFRKKVEIRKRSLLKQGPFCGEGRVGHGIKTRNKPVYDIEDKIARFRDTANHKYSRELINYALKNNCGVIHMEDLTGITSNADRFLKNWSYYDLQTKIKYKAEEVGIEVVSVPPANTSRRCSRCGYIDADNRKVQAKFKCLNCGYEANADYNASQNISLAGKKGIKDIDKITKKDYNKGK